MTKKDIELKVYTRDKHSISRRDIPQTALKVLYKLHEEGYQAFIVGGCIRDMLRGYSPKDIDVVTDATPEQVKSIFRNCRLIGRRFRLAHIYFGQEIIEVATFRADEKGEQDENGRVLNHNSFGTIETDVMRRDFTVNALYYNIADFAIYDYVDAMHDMDDGVIKIIGNALERYEEDPVRMLRAVRFAAKLGMRIESETEKSISKQKDLLENIPQARLFDETIKLFLSGHAYNSYQELRIHNLFGCLFPQTDEILNNFTDELATNSRNLIKISLKNTDYRLKHDEPVTIGFIYAAILWPFYKTTYKDKLDKGEHWYNATHESIDFVFSESAKRLGVPMRHKAMIREIWVMQDRLCSKLTAKKKEVLLGNKRFRAGFDFLEMRLKSGEKELREFYDIWVNAQIEMPELVKKKTKKRRRRKVNG